MTYCRRAPSTSTQLSRPEPIVGVRQYAKPHVRETPNQPANGKLPPSATAITHHPCRLHHRDWGLCVNKRGLAHVEADYNRVNAAEGWQPFLGDALPLSERMVSPPRLLQQDLRMLPNSFIARPPTMRAARKGRTEVATETGRSSRYFRSTVCRESHDEIRQHRLFSIYASGTAKSHAT